MDQFILFGDSITQKASTSLIPSLATRYIRRLDVVNRGFSGYNTRQALQVLPRVFPSPAQARVRFLVVFFGANDARLPDTGLPPQQHVPIAEYQDKLTRIVQHPCVRAHDGIRVVLVTPPPVDESMCMNRELGKPADTTREYQPLREAHVTAEYASAVRLLGAELGTPVLDIWSAMMSRASPNGHLVGSRSTEPCEALRVFLDDGLHLSRSGYELLDQELLGIIERTWPDQMPDELPMVFPSWDDEKHWEGCKGR